MFALARSRWLNVLFLTVAVAGLSGCGQKNLSDRDLRRQQQENIASIKREELAQAAGKYTGRLAGPDGYDQLVILTLEVKDFPEAQEGEVDPVLIPKLVGNLRFQYGEIGSSEYVDAPVKQADFAVSSSKLYVVVEHQQFKELVLQTTLVDRKKVNGSWTASSMGVQGTLELQKENSR